jgi:Tetratricopeptide repeat
MKVSSEISQHRRCSWNKLRGGKSTKVKRTRMKDTLMKTARIKPFARLLVFSAFATALIVMSLPQQGLSKKQRKLPIKSYITGAKIAYGKTVGDEGARPYDALLLLDSCTIWYGMIPEVYFWETLIHSDLAQQVAETDTVGRRERLTKMIGAADSLVLSCDKENKEVKKKYKKKCEPFQITADSIRSDWFATYYNMAQDNRTVLVDDIHPTLQSETDPHELEILQAQKDTLLQLISTDYGFAAILAPTDSLLQLVDLNLGSLYSELEDYQSALPYLAKSAENARLSDPGNYTNLLNQMAYANFKLKNLLEAARIWNEVANEVEAEEKISIINNILASFSILGNDDSLFYYNQVILDVDPANAGALRMIGGTWFNRIQDLNGENSKAKASGDDALVAEIKGKLELANDSAIVYLKRAFEADSTDEQSIKLFGIANMLKGDRNSATDAWLRLTALKPDNKSYWIYLAENYIALKDLKSAIPPYEKAVEIDASDADIWLRLIELYGPNGMKEKLKKAQAKYDALAKK